MVSWGPPPGYITHRTRNRLTASPPTLVCARNRCVDVGLFLRYHDSAAPRATGDADIGHRIPRAALCSRCTKGSARQVRGRFVVVSAGLRARSRSAGRRGGTFPIASSSSFSRQVGCHVIRARARHATRRHVTSRGAVTATSTVTAATVAVRRTRGSSERAPTPTLLRSLSRSPSPT